MLGADFITVVWCSMDTTGDSRQALRQGRMALAPSEPPGRLTAAATPPHARTAPTPATASSSRSPAASSHPAAPGARPHLDGRRHSDGAQLRTGGGVSRRRPAGCTAFQDRLLRDFYSTAVPGAIVPSPSPAAPLWATPGSSASVRRYNLAFVTNMLNYLLTACPGRRLSVTRVCPRVFLFAVANRNIAHALAARGLLRLGASLEEAVRADGKLEDEWCDTPPPNAEAAVKTTQLPAVTEGASGRSSEVLGVCLV